MDIDIEEGTLNGKIKRHRVYDSFGNENTKSGIRKTAYRRTANPDTYPVDEEGNTKY